MSLEFFSIASVQGDRGYLMEGFPMKIRDGPV